MKFNTVWLLLPALLTWYYEVQAKAVFAHFMVGNVASWGEARWETEIGVAQTAHLDAFALNIAYGDDTVWSSVANAFAAANAKTFKLFFSFDYAGGPGGAWPQDQVLKYLTNYINNGAYYHTDGGQPFVSTFEGPGNAADWVSIKAQTNAFFIPDYSSLGAGPALDTGVADGLFNWNAWPWGNRYMDTFVDASYYQVLGKYNVLGQPGPRGKPYMMAVSPMFYTNLPGFDKSWLWNPDYLWFDRWQEVLYLQPEYVQIISWNDWGECHYIGPQDQTQWDSVFGPTKGKAVYNYVDGYAHDGFRMMLPHVIDLYKTNKTVFNDELVVFWGRSSLVGACSANGTTGNTASQLQQEFIPKDVLQDRTFFWALLLNDANFTLTGSDGVAVPGRWIVTPQSYGGGVGGFYMGVVDTIMSGTVTAHLIRDNRALMANSVNVKSGCQGGNNNFNMWSGYATHTVNLESTLLISDFTGYCPPSACNCELIGPSSTITVEPGKTPGPGYPVENVNYAGLCGFACGKGYCPQEHCTSVSRAVPTPTISPFNPDACIRGSGLTSDFDDLCQWACTYGYCPIAACQCSGLGPLVKPPPVTATKVMATFLPTPGVMAYDDLCRFTCERGHCPSVCSIALTYWDVAPNFSNDSIPPYPTLKNPDGSNITIENLRGTRLYGFDGCSIDRGNVIAQAFKDMQTLAGQDGVYKNIDWNAEAATDFWGPVSSDGERIPDDTRSEIQKIFAAAEQIWGYPVPIFIGPGNYWRLLWIEVRCSDGTQGAGSPDPENKCGDALPNNGQCRNAKQPPPGTSNRLQAFSDNQEFTGTGYDRITFCDDFFKLKDLSVAVENGAGSARKTDLSIYDNTARCFLHEITHLDYFMGTGPTGPKDPASNLPWIWDLQITVNVKKKEISTPVYGPEYARILRNWVDPDPGNLGYFTQRNADTYAWFAMAKYVQTKIGQYPAQPRVGRRKPTSRPVNSANGLEPDDAPADLSTTSLDQYQIGGEEDASPLDFNYPGCPDRSP